MIRPEKTCESEDGNLMGIVQPMLSRCTQKRGRENNLSEMGDMESPSKMKRFGAGGHQLEIFDKQSD